MQWFYQSVAAAVLFIPAWLAIGFFGKNYAVRSEIFMLWYMIGMVFGILVINRDIKFYTPLGVICAIVSIGFTIGAYGNILVYRAVTTAPNPGLPISLLGITNISVFICAGVLGRILPRYFPPSELSYTHLMGIIFVIVGVALIAISTNTRRLQ